MLVKNEESNFWTYWGRFLIVYIILSILFSLVFLFLKDIIFPNGAEAIEFFKPYRSITFLSIAIEIFRGSIIALILYPFYDIIVKKDNSWMVLIGILWGLVLIGSVDTIPGSIEGFIYTKTTLLEHFIVIVFVAVQSLLFALIFINWERRSISPFDGYELVKKVDKKRYTWHFVLLHVVTYIVMGIIFMTLQDYAGAFATQERFALFRPLDSPIVGAGPFVQILRGGLLSIFVYPLFSKIIIKKNGWLLLFTVMFGFTAMSSYNMIPGMINTLVEGGSFADVMVGTVEITVQMLVFSILIFKWEKRSGRKEKQEK